MRTFNVPVTHPYIQNLTNFDLEFIECSTAFDNPKVLEKYLNTVYDDEFDDYWDETMSPKEEEYHEDVPLNSPPSAQNFHHSVANYSNGERFNGDIIKHSENANKEEKITDTEVNDWEEVD